MFNGLNHDLFCDKTSLQIKASVVIKYAEIIVKFNITIDIIFNTIEIQDFTSLGPLPSQHAKTQTTGAVLDRLIKVTDVM